jgi:radical SAM-linked protein
LKNVRIWFEKDGPARFISHLDLVRCMTRGVHRSRLPIWYTEGFNPHPFLTFPLPLSLGVRGRHEAMDVKLLEDMPEQEIIERMNPCLPEGIRVLSVTEPVMKPGRICYALYELRLTAQGVAAGQVEDTVKRVLALPDIVVPKKTKAGVKEVDIKENLCRYEFLALGDCAGLRVTLPAGSVNNVNPQLLLDAVKKYGELELLCDATRLELYNEEVEPFC